MAKRGKAVVVKIKFITAYVISGVKRLKVLVKYNHGLYKSYTGLEARVAQPIRSCVLAAKNEANLVTLCK